MQTLKEKWMQRALKIHHEEEVKQNPRSLRKIYQQAEAQCLKLLVSNKVVKVLTMTWMRMMGLSQLRCCKIFSLTTSHPHISIRYAGLCSYCLPQYALVFNFFLFNFVAIQYVFRTNSPRVYKHVTTVRGTPTKTSKHLRSHVMSMKPLRTCASLLSSHTCLMARLLMA